MDLDFWKGKKVLITGHTGFKGGWLSLVLNHLNAQLIGYSLNIPSHPNMFEICRLNSIIEGVQGDVIDYIHRLPKSMMEISMHFT